MAGRSSAIALAISPFSVMMELLYILINVGRGLHIETLVGCNAVRGMNLL